MVFINPPSLLHNTQQSNIGKPGDLPSLSQLFCRGSCFGKILLKPTQCSVSPQPFQYSYQCSKHVLDKFLIRPIAQQSPEQQ
jgi:hypothetical protein